VPVLERLGGRTGSSERRYPIEEKHDVVRSIKDFWLRVVLLPAADADRDTSKLETRIGQTHLELPAGEGRAWCSSVVGADPSPEPPSRAALR